MSHNWSCLVLPTYTLTKNRIKMAALCTFPNVEHFIREKIVNERKTLRDVSRELTAMNPGMRGISARSIRRFCHQHNIHATSRLSRFQLDRVVATSIKKVHNMLCHYYAVMQNLPP